VPRTIGVAVNIPEPWGSELHRFRKEAGDPQAETIPPHVTIVGPVEIEADTLPAVEQHLAEVSTRHSAFDLHLRGTGTFRPVTDVVFVVVASGISECEMLERDVRRGPIVRERVFPYHPHVTVAHDISAEQLDIAYERLSGFEARFRVAGFTLFEHGEDGYWRPRRDFPFAT
jgi:2'-5' RNA ligase